MKTVILCGGQGTRMKEETEFKPKPLVEIGGKPILWHIMKIYAHHGYNEFILALGYKGNLIKDHFLNWRAFENNFTLNTKNNELIFHNNECDDFKITFVETGLYSLTGERVLRVKKYLDNDEHFMLTYGDGVANINIKQLVDFHLKQGTIGTITGMKLPANRFGLLNINQDNSKICGFHQHNISESSVHNYLDNYVNGGFMVFSRNIFDYIMPNAMIESVFTPLIEDKQLSVYQHDGDWKCMDTHREMEEMNELWQKNPFWKMWE